MRNQNPVVKVVLALITVIYTLAFLFAGLLFLLADIDELSTWVIDDFVHSFLGKLTGAIMLVLVVGSIVLRVLRFKKEEYISFENPDGEVIIAIRAIEDFLRRLARSFNEVKEITPTIIPLNEGVDVDLRLVLWDDENVHVTVDKIKSIMRDQIQNFFGVANIHSIRIYVTKTVSRERYVEQTESAPEKP